MEMLTYPLFTTGFISNGENLLYGLFIGIIFGFILERTGFARSINIVPVFYFRDLRVSQVMVSAILTCSTWIIIAVFNGWLDFNQLFIPTTYLWPYMIGGALFGLSMIMAGWCPGTAVIGFATGKIDAAIFLLGIMFGMYFYFYIYSFDFIIDFANSGNMGKYTIHNALNTTVYTSFLITVALGVGLMIFMRAMKFIRDRKGEDI
ncbi:Rhodanese domain protein [hydrothermal vent metagenome]|uniref:Rhodanese domain protein n=1 Tax=hydrothermal vent metagenome TaxID=652676 RepID=A0A3B1DXW1_9ZZZZ